MEDRINIAIAEAMRFIAKAQRALREIRTDKYTLVTGNKEIAAMRRSSMDLSRALVGIRQPK